MVIICLNDVLNIENVGVFVSKFDNSLKKTFFLSTFFYSINYRYPVPNVLGLFYLTFL